MCSNTWETTTAMTSVTLLITVLVSLAALAPKLAYAHGYMMVRAPCMREEPITAPCMWRSLQIRLVHTRLQCDCIAWRHPKYMEIATICTEIVHVLQKPISRSWLAAGQRFANYYSPDGFYGPMNLNRSTINPLLEVLCLHR